MNRCDAKQQNFPSIIIESVENKRRSLHEVESDDPIYQVNKKAPFKKYSSSTQIEKKRQFFRGKKGEFAQGLTQGMSQVNQIVNKILDENKIEKGRLYNNEEKIEIKIKTLRRLIKKIQSTKTDTDGQLVKIKERLKKKIFYLKNDLSIFLLIVKKMRKEGYANLYKAWDLRSHKIVLLKVSKPPVVNRAISNATQTDAENQAKKEILQEHAFLTIFNREKTQTALPALKSACFNFKDKNGKIQTAFAKEMLKRDISTGSIQKQLEKMELLEKLQFCEPLLQALAAMHKKNYIHGALSLHSCLWSTDPQGNPERLVINDFRSVRKLAAEKKNKQSLKEHSFYKFDQCSKEDEISAKRADVFAMCKLLIELLSGPQWVFSSCWILPASPGSLKAEDPLPKAIKRFLTEKKDLPGKAVDLLLSGLCASETIPTAKDLRRAWKAIIHSLRQGDSSGSDSLISLMI